MHKIVSIILSGVMVLGSVLPSYGEGLAGLRRERARVGVYEAASDNTRMGKGIEMAVLRGQRVHGETTGKGLLAEVEGLYKGGGYNEFAREYKRQAGEAYAEAVAGASDAVSRNILTEAYKEMVEEGKIRAAYEQLQEDSSAEVAAYIKGLGARIAAYGESAGADVRVVRELVLKGLSGFAASGLIEKEVKEFGADFLVKDIALRKGACGEVGFIEGLSGKKVSAKQEGCEEVLEEVAALAVLGEAEDGAVVADLMEEGYKGVMGPTVILVGGAALYEMGAYGALSGVIYKAGKGLTDVGVFSGDYSVISLQDWVKGVKEFRQDGMWGEKEEGGWYEGEGRAKNSAWMELGEFLGEEARKGSKGAQGVLGQLSGVQLYVKDNGGVDVRLKSFWAGVLSAGYRVEMKDVKRSGATFNGRGGVYNADNSAGLAALEKNLAGAKMTLSGYLSAMLYGSGKSDLDAYTKVKVNNALVKGYKKSGSADIGLKVKNGPNAKDLADDRYWNWLEGVGFAMDIALVVVGVAGLGRMAVKGGVEAVKALSSAVREARAGKAVISMRGMRGAGQVGKQLRMKFTERLGRQLEVKRMEVNPEVTAEMVYGGAKGQGYAVSVEGNGAVSVSKVAGEPQQGSITVRETRPAQAAPKRAPAKASAMTDFTLTSPRLVPVKDIMEASLTQEMFGGVSVAKRAPKRSPTSKKARRALQRTQAAEKKVQSQNMPPKPQPYILPRTHHAFFNQGRSLLLRYLRNTYNLTPDALKDVNIILSRAESMPDGVVLKQALFRRLENLLKGKDTLIRRYASSVKRSSAKPGVRVYYLGDKRNITLSSFEPELVVLAMEEPLQMGTLPDLPSIIRQVNRAKIFWRMNEKGPVTIRWLGSRGKGITAKNFSHLYSQLLGCSPYSLCFYEWQGDGTLMLYRSDRKLWLRVGEHEVTSKIHLHLHTEKWLPVNGGLQRGGERVILNYRVHLDEVAQALRPAKRLKGRAAYEVKHAPVKETEGYRILVQDALREMVREGVVVRL